MIHKNYVEQRDGGYWLHDTRISLDSIVYAFNHGVLPESIQRAFPLLTLEEVYGAITFYLAHKAAIDMYLQRGEVAYTLQAKTLNAAARLTHPELFQRLEHARRLSESPHA
jgi:uncharacterized protein (DUF433 family)